MDDSTSGSSLFDSVKKRMRELSSTSQDAERQFWMPDSRAKQCYDCGVTFSTFRRRHHCRICGQVFCHRCSFQMIDAKIYKNLTGSDATSPVRSCRYCYRATLRNDSLQSATTTTSAHSSSQASSSRGAQTIEIDSRKRDVSRRTSTDDRMEGSNSWRGFGTTLARRFSSTASLGSFVNSFTPSQDRRRPDSVPRPLSSNSDHLEGDVSRNGRPAGSELQNSSSFDNLHLIINRMDEKLDENKPNWVKELLEQNKLEEEEEEKNFSNDLHETSSEAIDANSMLLDYSSSDLVSENATSKDDRDSNILEIHTTEDGSGIVRFRKTTASPPTSLSKEERKRKLKKLFGETIDSCDFEDAEQCFFDGDESMEQYLPQEWNTMNPASPEVMLPDTEELPRQLMEILYDRHLRRLLQQVLLDYRLQQDWLPVIHDLSKRISNTVTLSHHSYLANVDNYFFFDAENEGKRRGILGRSFSPMDLRQRIKIKCIAGDGFKQESSIIKGLVFTKNVAHRRMRTRIDGAKVLLFACSIGYDERKRTLESGKLTCMDLLRLQEQNYVENLCTKIGALKPDVVFVQGSVSGTVLERLFELFGITVVLNVKKTVMERLALFTGTQLIFSPEILNATKLGRCSCFRILECQLSHKRTKSLMVVETDNDSLGCSVLLRGTNKLEEFSKIKRILEDAVFLHYNARCELALNGALNCLPMDPKNETTGELWKNLQEIFQKITRHRLNSSKSSMSILTQSENGQSENSQNRLQQQQQQQVNASSSKLTAIDDHSDPLRKPEEVKQEFSDESDTDEVTAVKKNLFVTELSNTISEKCDEILKFVLLSSSPNVQYPLPFLMERDIYSRSCLRPYFSLNLLKSQRLEIQLEQQDSGIIVEEVLIPTSLDASEHEEDIDYRNFNYLSNLVAEQVAKYPELREAIVAKAETKLAVLRNILRQRYMIEKPHPLLSGRDGNLARMERYCAPDFRACGPYLRCVPDILPRNSSKTKSIDADKEEQRSSEPLSMSQHQRISVQFSVFSPQSKNAPNYCFKPRIVDIQFYAKNDMSLGAFLFRHFFFMRTRNFSSDTQGPELENFKKIFCPNETCFASMLRHVMRFAHHRGTLTVLVNRVQDSKNHTLSQKVLTWNYCKGCKRRSKIAELAQDALALSFGKFLELKFYANDAVNLTGFEQDSLDENCCCEHSIKRDSFQFFNFDQLVVSFKYDPIVLYEVSPPAPFISITRNQFSRKILADSVQDLTVRGHEMFSKLEAEIEKLTGMISTAGASTITTSQNVTLTEQYNFDASVDVPILEEFREFISEERERFAQQLKEVLLKVSDVSVTQMSLIELYRIQNSILRVKKLVMEAWANWNEKLMEFLQNRKKIADKSFTRVMKSILPGSSNDGGAKNFLSDTPIVETDQDQGALSSKLSSSTLDLSEPRFQEEKPLFSRSQTVSAGTTGKLGSITSRVISKVTKATTFDTNSVNDARQSELFTSLPHPFESTSTERYLLPASSDLTVIVKDKDLGSIIAYALKTQEYEQKLANIRDAQANELQKQQDASAVDGNTASAKPVIDEIDEFNPHIGIDFQDGNAKFYCFVYFAAEFAHLRSLMLADGGPSHREARVRSHFIDPEIGRGKFEAEELFVHSLANCIPWNAIGGKSGSTFSKTSNQRFILKEISKGELKHFVTFARDYVQYCEDALLNRRASAFVKIVGCYELAVSDSIHNILVMENLFYECNISFIYDLKGSMRNRKVEISAPTSNTNNAAFNDFDSDGDTLNDSKQEQPKKPSPSPSQTFIQTTTVLMDENLRQISTLYPLYVHVHSKRLLLEALVRDSDFLKTKGVMDYSLLVGFDEQYSEYVVGIIDYVRLYDFTKEIEFRVKKLGKTIDPTIVRPLQYQKRFLEAIQEYFIEIPDKWVEHLQQSTLSELGAKQEMEDSCGTADRPGLDQDVADADVISFATLKHFEP